MVGFMERRFRLRSSLFSAGLIVVALGAALSGCAVNGGEGCTISGTASFTPGLTTKAQNVSYTFSGTFSGCQSVGGDKTIKSGTVTASGSGSNLACTGGNSSGTATVNWNNGQSSTINLTTKGGLNAVVVTGTVVAGEFAGATDHAVLAFTVTNPTACNTAGGVTSATFKGESTPK